MKRSIYLFALAACTSLGLMAQETPQEETLHINIVKVVNGETITIDTVISASDLEAFEKEFPSDDVQNVNIWIDDEGNTHKEIERVLFISEEEMEGMEMKVEVTIDEDGNETILLNGEEITKEELESMHEVMIMEMENVEQEHVFIMEIADDSEMEVKVEVDENGVHHFFLNGEEMTEEEFKAQMEEHHAEQMFMIKELGSEEMGMERHIFINEGGEEQEVRVEVDDEGNKRVWINGEEVSEEEMGASHHDFWQSEDGKEVIVEEMTVGGKDHKVIIIEEQSEDGDVEFIREGTEVIEVRQGSSAVFVIRVEVEDADEDELEMLQEGNNSFVSGNTLYTSEFNLFPNPSNGEITVEFELANKGRTSLQIFDQNARLVYEEDLGKIEGHWSKKIDLQQYGSGVYFLNLVQGDQALTKKFIVE